MCSIAIPSELLLGHSPPVYGSLLYSSLMVTTPPIANRSVPPRIRPCLAAGSIHLQGLLKSNDDAAINKRNKKKVVFADDRGRPLTQVRVMSEPSNVPPLWTSAYLAGVTRGDGFRAFDSPTAHVKNEPNPWEPTFAQPASDYLAFRSKLDKDSVSLENVIVRESEQTLVGTVKVKNLAYDKEIVIRMTVDCWKSHDDIVCSYVEQPGLVGQTAVRNLYDTFRFRVALPLNSNVIEFCVKYRTSGFEFWDNNCGKNYVVSKKQDVTTELDQVETLGSNGVQMEKSQSPRGRKGCGSAEETFRASVRSWSEFASWHHFDNNAPYCASQMFRWLAEVLPSLHFLHLRKNRDSGLTSVNAIDEGAAEQDVPGDEGPAGDEETNARGSNVLRNHRTSPGASAGDGNGASSIVRFIKSGKNSASLSILYVLGRILLGSEFDRRI